MVHRFTLKEMEDLSDLEICYILVNDKMASGLHPYSPLRDRLNQVIVKLDGLIQDDDG